VKRNRYETVTSKESFAILIPTSVDKAMGEATFHMEIGGPTPVRPVSLRELEKTRRNMKGIAAARFFAVLALRDALEARDTTMLEKAKEKLEKVYQMVEKAKPVQSAEQEKLQREIGELMAPLIGLSPAESMNHYEGIRPGSKAKVKPERLLSYEISKTTSSMMNASIVLWWVDGSFRPAIYCINEEMALYIHTFFIAPIGERGFRICPKCAEQFLQKTPNQVYCVPAHGSAHRVARCRNKKKESTTKD
jgi:hypothetical protein